MHIHVLHEFLYYKTVRKYYILLSNLVINSLVLSVNIKASNSIARNGITRALGTLAAAKVTLGSLRAIVFLCK